MHGLNDVHATPASDQHARPTFHTPQRHARLIHGVHDVPSSPFLALQLCVVHDVLRSSSDTMHDPTFLPPSFAGR